MIEDQNSSYKMACVVRPPLFMGARRTLFYDSSIVCRPYHREEKSLYIKGKHISPMSKSFLRRVYSIITVGDCINSGGDCKITGEDCIISTGDYRMEACPWGNAGGRGGLYSRPRGVSRSVASGHLTT